MDTGTTKRDNRHRCQSRVDGYLLSNERLRLPNRDEGHARLGELARTKDTLVCFEATGGQEPRLWSALDIKGIATRQLPSTPR